MCKLVFSFISSRIAPIFSLFSKPICIWDLQGGQGILAITHTGYNVYNFVAELISYIFMAGSNYSPPHCFVWTWVIPFPTCNLYKNNNLSHLLIMPGKKDKIKNPNEYTMTYGGINTQEKCPIVWLIVKIFKQI